MSNSGNDDLTLDTVFVTGQQQGGSIVYQGMQWQGFGPNSIYNDAFDFAQFDEDGFVLNDPSPDDGIYGLEIKIGDDGSVTVIVELTGFVDANGNKIRDIGYDPVSGTMDGDTWSKGLSFDLNTTYGTDEYFFAIDWLKDFIPFDDGFA